MAEAMLKFFDHEHQSQAVEYDEEDGRPGSMDNSLFNENNLSVCEDIVINQSFPRQPTDSNLIKSIEYRVKLLSLRKVLLQPGETATLLTNAVVNRKPGQLSLLIKPPENFPSVFFLSEGNINPQYRGRLTVTVQNASNNILLIAVNTVIGYLILTPFLE